MVETIEKNDQPKKAVEQVQQNAETMTADQKKEAAELFDAQKYETDKTHVIDRIKAMRLNPNFLDKTEYNNTVFLSEKTPMVKTYLAYYNGIAAKANMEKAGSMQPINDVEFLKRFEQEKQQNVIVKASDGKEADYPRIDQKIGKILEPTPQRKQEISSAFGDLMKSSSHIDALTLYGYADSTRVTELGTDVVVDTYNKLRQTLIQKGLAENKLSNCPANFITKESSQDQLNKGWALCRAMAQIAFLPREQVTYLDKNIVKLTISEDAKKIGEKKTVGDQYTGAKMEMSTIGKSEITQFENILKMIDIKHINYVTVNKQKGEIEYVGGIQLGIHTGKVNTVSAKNTQGSTTKSRNERKIYSVDPNMKGYETLQGTGVLYGNRFGAPKSGETNPLNIVISRDDPRIKYVKNSEGKSTFELEPMKIADTNEAFLESLKEAQTQATNDPEISNYIASIIPVVNTYINVVAEMNSLQAKQQKAYEVINAQK